MRAEPSKPNLIVIGAQKCGTTSLHHYLNLHPDISMSARKELNFFVDQFNWSKGAKWYAAQFANGAKIRGESSPSYTMFPHFDGVPQRMHALLPAAKLIYLVRDPVERIVSHYLHQWYAKRVHQPLDQIVADPESELTRHYIRTSSYFLQLSQYLDYYDPARILVIGLEAFKTDPDESMKRIFRFLAVDDTPGSLEFSKALHQTQKKQRRNRLGDWVLSRHPLWARTRSRAGRLLPASVKQGMRSLMGTRMARPRLNLEGCGRLKETLREDAARFRELTGQPFSEWCV